METETSRNQWIPTTEITWAGGSIPCYMTDGEIVWSNTQTFLSGYQRKATHYMLENRPEPPKFPTSRYGITGFPADLPEPHSPPNGHKWEYRAPGEKVSDSSASDYRVKPKPEIQKQPYSQESWCGEWVTMTGATSLYRVTEIHQSGITFGSDIFRTWQELLDLGYRHSIGIGQPLQPCYR